MNKTMAMVGACALLLTGAASAETLRFATEGAYPPFNFINDAGLRDSSAKCASRAAGPCTGNTTTLRDSGGSRATLSASCTLSGSVCAGCACTVKAITPAATR